MRNLSLSLLAVLLFSSWLPAQSDTKTAGSSHGVAVGVNASTLGIGAQAAIGLTRKLNLRGGFDLFNYNRTFTRDGIHYDGTLDLRSGQVLLDWFPGGRVFHISPGVLLYNGNQLNANASVPAGHTFTLGSTTFRSNPADPVTGKGKMDFNKAGPMILFGFGNPVPRTRHFSVNFDLGIAYHGTPAVSLALAGSACDVTGAVCRNAATDPVVQSARQSEVYKLNKDAEPYKVYPVISIGVGYRF